MRHILAGDQLQSKVVERRSELIESDRNIGLIEQPEYKRRWNTEPWESQLERALRDWLLDRLESYFEFDGRMVTGHSSLVTGHTPEGGQWWTFGGSTANASLAGAISGITGVRVTSDDLTLHFESPIQPTTVHAAIDHLRHQDPAELRPPSKTPPSAA